MGISHICQIWILVLVLLAYKRLGINSIGTKCHMCGMKAV